MIEGESSCQKRKMGVCATRRVAASPVVQSSRPVVKQGSGAFFTGKASSYEMVAAASTTVAPLLGSNVLKAATSVTLMALALQF